MSVIPFLMSINPFPASVTCSWHVSRSSQHVCHHYPGGCHLLPSVCHPHPGVCHLIPSVSPLPGIHHTFPSICHPFPACYPISSMSPPFWDGSPCLRCVSPLWVPDGLRWDTPLLMESPHLGKGKNPLLPFHFHGPNWPCPSATTTTT